MILYDDYDTQVIKREDQYFLRFGEGGAAEYYVEIEISKADAETVIADISYSTKLVCDYHNKMWGLV